MLVVEDSAKMAALLKKGLQREGYAVDVASSGTDAIWMAGECNYDVIVLDIILEDGEPPVAGCAVWTRALMTTSPSPSRCPSYWPGSGRCCDAARCRGRPSCESVTCRLT